MNQSRFLTNQKPLKANNVSLLTAYYEQAY